MFNILSSAHASAPEGVGGIGVQIMQFAPFIAVFAVMYFLVIRPQNKRAREMKAMLDSIKKGDRVVTSGGIIGQISKIVDENELHLTIADGVDVRVIRASISQVLSKTNLSESADAGDSPVRKAIAAKKTKK